MRSGENLESREMINNLYKSKVSEHILKLMKEKLICREWIREHVIENQLGYDLKIEEHKEKIILLDIALELARKEDYFANYVISEYEKWILETIVKLKMKELKNKEYTEWYKHNGIPVKKKERLEEFESWLRRLEAVREIYENEIFPKNIE